MKTVTMCWILVVLAMLGLPAWTTAAEPRELSVHLAQANNSSPYTFVRAKLRPGELSDPWAVRFVGAHGEDIPYFVWDSITWRVAQQGRTDWGNRYALLNHAPGCAPGVLQARAQKLQWGEKNLPELGLKLKAEEEAARTSPDSICAALYLLHHRVPPFGKERITLRIDAGPQAKPLRRQWKGATVNGRIAIKQGDVEFRGLPDRLGVAWKGKEIFRYAGFDAGAHADHVSHADPSRPFVIQTTEGMITKVAITGQTNGRQGGLMDWQCTYWLFPEGCYVALEGFSLGDTSGYLGGPQQLSIWQAGEGFRQRQVPSWDKPWWLHQTGASGFVATHLFYATPLSIGFGNNPFAVNAEGANKDPRVEAAGDRLALRWAHHLDDPAIQRLMVPHPLRRPGEPAPKDSAEPVRWEPNIDWLYRQTILGVGMEADSAEASLRDVLGAAAGWIDRPVREEDLASLLVRMMPRIATSRETAEIGLLKIVPAVLEGDQAAIREALRRTKDPAERTDYYIRLIRKHVERGGKPSEGRKKDDPDGTPREGWTGNPCYHAALMPCYVRVLEFFDLPVRQEAYHDAILRFADFTLELLGGKPIDWERLNTVCQSEWPSRIVPIIPLMVHAYTLRPEEEYARAAKMVFDDLMRLVERNPHGYWPAWTFQPKADKFDTVYNPVGYERGITTFWSDGQLDRIGRDRAAKFVTAQARWLVYSGQLLDSFETDNATAIRASQHGAHTNLRNQIGIYLYDDFEFYRGLVAELVAWSAACCQVPGPVDASGTGPYRSLELSNAGSSMLRWALDIRPGGKWLESQVRRLPKSGFRLQAWNRLPHAKPTITVKATEVGLKSEADVLQVQLDEPAYRLPAEFETTWSTGKVSLKLSRPAKIRLCYRVLRPEWPANDKPTLQKRAADGTSMPLHEKVTWNDGSFDWQATPGEYEIVMPGR